jgi:hypothetical protein
LVERDENCRPQLYRACLPRADRAPAHKGPGRPRFRGSARRL